MKAWNEVTERERGWIEGLLTSNRMGGKRGSIDLRHSRVTVWVGSSADAARKLRSLLGGQIIYSLKKRAFVQIHQEGAAAGTVYSHGNSFAYAWFAEGDEFDYAVSCLDELDLPINLRNGIDAYFAVPRAA